MTIRGVLLATVVPASLCTSESEDLETSALFDMDT